MSNYVSKYGDTFSIISRLKYGAENFAGNILKANPGVSEPIPINTNIFIPDVTDFPNDAPSVLSSDSDSQVSMLIDGNSWKFWTSISITRSIDSIDSVSFVVPSSLANESFNVKTFRDTFVPFSFKTVQIYVGGSLFFTGFMLDVVPELTATSRTVNVTCYSKSGVLNDCTPPSSDFPLEYNRVSLDVIVKSLLKPFGLSVTFGSDSGAAFEKVSVTPSSKILDFLAPLASQRNLVISSKADGGLLFDKSISTGKPLAVLGQGEPPLVSVSATFNPQEYFSHITGLEPSQIGRAGEAYTVINSKLSGVLRPVNFEANDTEDGNLKTSVESKIGRMFGNMVSYSVVVSTWFDSNGDIWKPNTLIKLQSDDAMIYSSYSFIIRSVELAKDDKSESATLELILPGSFSGKIPEILPWE